MQMATNPSKGGFASLDALVSLVPLVMLLVYVMQLAGLQSSLALQRSSSQQLFDKLVSVADYAVKSGAVRREGGIRYPNWIDEGLLVPPFTESLLPGSGLRSLYIGTAEPEAPYAMCVYRLVVLGDERSAGRLFVCGS